MITLSKSGNSVTFTFDENSGYLQNGTIDVPVNSLSLITDESDMATFRKSASNDIFISARYEEFGMSKAELEAWYKANMVGSTGGGVDSGTVQTMIDESISGKAESVSAVSSAEYVSSSTTINFKNVDGDVISSIDASDFVIDGMIDDVRIETISGVSYLVIDFNTASGKEDIQIPLTDIFDPSNYYTKQEVDASLSGKQDTITAGRGIDISANTISFDLPISAGTGTNSLIMSGSGNTASGDYSVAYGKLNSASGECSTANGNRNTANNFAEFSIGQKNVSRTEDSSAFGHSGNTLFSVGNGIINEEQGIDANHNAFEVRGNGEIYISDTNAAGSYYQKPMINLQDTLNGKQNTLSAGTNITISGNVISAEGGGKSIEAGRGIAITTGATADTVSFSLPISAGTGTGALVIASDTYDINNKARGNYSVSLNGGGLHPNYAYATSSLAEGMDTKAYGSACHSEGYGSKAGVQNNINIQYAHAEGDHTEAKGTASHTEGSYTIANNRVEHASGQYNISSSASTTFGDSGNTLFSVGNGTSTSARHNAFEIRQNGDIYLTKDGQDVKLQDQLGGGEVSSAITSGDTNAVAGGAVYDKFDEVEQVTAAALNALNDRLSEDEEVTAAGLNAVNSALGGLKLQQITQSAYDALVTKDASTLYIIVN